MTLTLQGARISNDLTQKDVAIVLGITERTYIKKEQDVKKFTLKELVVLKKLLRLTVEEFVEIFLNSKK